MCCAGLQRNFVQGKKKPCKDDKWGRYHSWDEISPNPLPVYKKIVGGVRERCKYCGSMRDNYDYSAGLV